MLRLRDILVASVWFYAATLNSSNRLLIKPFAVSVVIFHYFLCLLTSNDLSVNVSFKSKPVIYHALSIVVGSGVDFGHQVTLRARVTIGEKFIGSKKGPVVGDRVEFGVNSCVFGEVSIPDKTLIKANSILS
jgi:serine acetyltransferase